LETELASRFDFAAKLSHFPDRVDAVLDRDFAEAISTIYLDVNTDICNHSCYFCDGFFRSLHLKQFPWPRLSRLIDEMEDLHVLSVVIAGDRGEPFLHPHIGELLARLNSSRMHYGIYTNGTRIKSEFMGLLRHSAFVRVSADAATEPVHRRMHGYPDYRHDFVALTRNLERLAPIADDLGVSFILDRPNYQQIEAAADLYLSLGVHFIEYKPRYLPGYAVDTDWMRTAAPVIDQQISRARERWGPRVVLNSQVEQLLAGGPARSLVTHARPCRTSLLRLVVSTHGCYTCTPYRGEAERAVGNIFEQTLREVVESMARRALVDRPCHRLCAYHQQNEELLAIEAGIHPLPGRTAPATPQDYLI
jgi:MoaA/NifB/PqqE/SkfB family radical SAM enzyme